jgi:hypothetical protein
MKTAGVVCDVGRLTEEAQSATALREIDLEEERPFEYRRRDRRTRRRQRGIDIPHGG